MVSSIKVILALTVMAILAYTGYAIKCHQCHSAITPNCEKEIGPGLDCKKISPPQFLEVFFPALNATGCKKDVYDFPEFHAIIRSCFYGNINNIPEDCRTDPNCEICTTDGCN
ncbi:uncharacterized protein LOC108041136 [Drosophila rhopaloa]|uniref:Uncharacterized protein LOC108041136 n=1 Tax=Drosophila rhopaloa TaxID=1041015 RepID=A0A6P4E8T7_DRORH|nr:uncharacterized protein LOC108041136 [Drosophila rhopaloa]